jgi:hypothetical protein
MRRFGAINRLHLQGRRVSQERNQQEEILAAAYLLGLLFDLEDGGDMFFRNVTLFSN